MKKVTVLNDQGGGVMSVTEDKVATLRAQTHGHESIVAYEETYCVDAAIATGGNSTAQGKCWYKDISPTLKAGGVHGVAYAAGFRARAGWKSGGVAYHEQVAPTLQAEQESHVIYEERQRDTLP